MSIKREVIEMQARILVHPDSASERHVNPIATVITAVWHQQKDKEALLAGHMENLRRQTAPHRAIYVFDAGDAAPAWLEGTKITVSDPLTLYQAWNIALANVMTPLVMNLNVDDRLAPDAIEVMAGDSAIPMSSWWVAIGRSASAKRTPTMCGRLIPSSNCPAFPNGRRCPDASGGSAAETGPTPRMARRACGAWTPIASCRDIRIGSGTGH